jgi:CHAT domain-containing protein
VLIDPVLPFLNGIRRLYIIPGREMESLPFECLVMGGKDHLPELFAVTYHLSLSEVTPDQCLKLKKETGGRSDPSDFLAFSPAFSENRGLQKTGNTADEVNEIGMMFSDAGYVSKVFTEEDADETTFLREAGNGSIVHIATHAKVDRSIPERSGLHLWKQTPAISGDELIDGILEMGEVKGMRFRCRLLTLSSCTLGSRDPQARKSKINLPGDFLDAGAQRVLYSLWNVSDRHTRTLMTDFYRLFLEGDDFAEALRKAKVKMLNNPATASPYFWSAFILGSK